MKLSATERRNLQTLLLMSVFEPGTIGKRIAEARKAKGLTQEDLGDLVGVATRTVQNHEAGATEPWKNLNDYAKVLGRDVRWFLYGETEETQEAREVREEVGEIRALVHALVADRGLDPDELLRDVRLRREEPQPEDADHELPGEAREAG